MSSLIPKHIKSINRAHAIFYERLTDFHDGFQKKNNLTNLELNSIINIINTSYDNYYEYVQNTIKLTYMNTPRETDNAIHIKGLHESALLIKNNLIAEANKIINLDNTTKKALKVDYNNKDYEYKHDCSFEDYYNTIAVSELNKATNIVQKVNLAYNEAWNKWNSMPKGDDKNKAYINVIKIADEQSIAEKAYNFAKNTNCICDGVGCVGSKLRRCTYSQDRMNKNSEKPYCSEHDCRNCSCSVSRY